MLFLKLPIIGQTYTKNKYFPCPWTLINLTPTGGNGVIIEANKINKNDNTKSKVNMALLIQKLQAAKALQQKNLLEATNTSGFGVADHTSAGPNANNEKEHPPIGNIVANRPEENVQTHNEAVDGPIAKANHEV